VEGGEKGSSATHQVDAQRGRACGQAQQVLLQMNVAARSHWHRQERLRRRIVDDLEAARACSIACSSSSITNTSVRSAALKHERHRYVKRAAAS
jgi:hypothetical protein